jgi:hypothetical protein
MRTGRAQLGSRPAALPRVTASEAVPPLGRAAADTVSTLPLAPRLGRAPRRRTALLIGAPSEPRDRRQNQNTPGGGADGVGDEYAISAAANPEADQSAHRRPIHPTDAADASPAPQGVFCHAARRRDERKDRPPPCGLATERDSA